MDGFKVSDAMWNALTLLTEWEANGVQIVSLGLLSEAGIQARTISALVDRQFVTATVAGTVDITEAGRRALESHHRIEARHEPAPVEAPKRRPPFSNGTEERAWMGLWCEFCDHDHAMHGPDGENGCGLVVKYLVDGAPDEWIEAPEPPFHLPKNMRCTQYQPCQECGDGGPKAVEVRAMAPEAP